MGSYVPLLVLMRPYVFLCFLIKSLCILMGLCGTLFVFKRLYEPYGSLYVLMDSNESLWVFLGFYASLYVLMDA